MHASQVMHSYCICLQASELPWREPLRGLNLNLNLPSLPSLKGVNIDKLADDLKVPIFLDLSQSQLHDLRELIASCRNLRSALAQS